MAQDERRTGGIGRRALLFGAGEVVVAGAAAGVGFELGRGSGVEIADPKALQAKWGEVKVENSTLVAQVSIFVPDGWNGDHFNLTIPFKNNGLPEPPRNPNDPEETGDKILARVPMQPTDRVATYNVSISLADYTVIPGGQVAMKADVYLHQPSTLESGFRVTGHKLDVAGTTVVQIPQ